MVKGWFASKVMAKSPIFVGSSRGSYSIADIAIFPWVRNLLGFYDAGALVGIDNFPNVQRVLASFVARPAVARGLDIPKRS